MDYSLLLIIVKNDEKVEKIIRQMKDTSFIFYIESRNFLVVMGIIDYL